MVILLNGWDLINVPRYSHLNLCSYQYLKSLKYSYPPLLLSPMNSLAILAVLYIFMLIGSATILYISFKGQVDISGRYFFIAEFMMIPALVLVTLTNVDPSFANPKIFFPSNILGMISEISIIFGIYCLSRDIQITKYCLAIGGAVLFCAAMEGARALLNPNLPLLVSSLASAALAFFTYIVCRSQVGLELKSNPFLRWLGYFEIGIGIFSLIRASSYFTAELITPRNPTPAVSIMYALFISLSVFRYIAYQSLRTSWIDPRTNQPNALNKNLAKAIEEKDQLLRSLMTSNRVLGISALASSLAHQLSQPLTAIALQTEAVRRKVSKLIDDHDATDSLNKIAAQVAKLSELVENLRHLFTFRGNHFLEINLQRIVSEILEITEPTLATKNIKLTKIFTANPNIYGDGVQLQQVLINVLNNAVDSIVESNPSIRQINITISQNEKFAIIGISDSGNGIAKEMLPTLFDLCRTTKKEGLGVGLWLSKNIIDKHNGHIVASNDVQGGALFEIHVPLAQYTESES